MSHGSLCWTEFNGSCGVIDMEMMTFENKKAYSKIALSDAMQLLFVFLISNIPDEERAGNQYMNSYKIVKDELERRGRL
jgi:hypothetical protein